MRGDAVRLHGAVAPFRRDIDLPAVAFAHAGQDDLPAHDQVADHEQRRKRIALRRIEDGAVDEPAGIVNIHDAPGRGLPGPPSRFQHFVHHAVVEDDDARFPGFLREEAFIGRPVGVGPSVLLG